MVVSCWSSKGGAGTTVAAVALTLTLGQVDEDAAARGRGPGGARVGRGALVVDASGDVATVLGLPEPTGPGLSDWLAAGADVPPDGLARVEIEVSPGISLLPRGEGELGHAERAEVLAAILAAEPRHVVIDCGCLSGPLAGTGDARVRRLLAASAGLSLLVTRPCYLALRRAVAAPIRPDGVIVVAEPGRSLRSEDVSAVLDAPVLTTLPWDSGIARAVDAGLLVSRMPKALAKAIARAA